MKNPIPFRSLRFKLMFASTVVEVLMLALLLGNSMRLIDTAMVASTESALAQHEPLLNIAIAPYLLEGDYATLQDNLNEIVGSNGIEYVVVRDQDGRVAASAGIANVDALPAPMASAAEALSERVMHVERRLGLGGQTLGVLRFGLSTAIMSEARQSLLRQSMVIASIEVALTFILLSMIAYWVTGSLGELIDSTQAIAKGRYDLRVPEIGHDELGMLARNFNDMAEAVEKQMGALHASENEYRTLFEQAAVGIAHITLDGDRWLRVNRTLRQILGYDDASLSRMTLAELCRQEDLENLREARRALLKGELEMREVEWQIRRGDGSLMWSRLTASLQYDDQGEPLYFIFVVQDIGQQKQAGLALLRSEERYRRLVESTQVVPWEGISEGRRISYIGPQIQQLLGYPIDRWFEESFLFSVMEMEDSTVAREQFARPNAEFECRLRHRDGRLIWFACLVSRIWSGDSETKLQGFLLDISARKASEFELADYRCKLEELVERRTVALAAANKELEAFSYSVSHDLRSPLRTIEGFSQILQEDYAPVLDQTGQDYLQRIRAAASRMGELIEAMLRLARVSRTDIRLVETDLSAIVGRAADELRAREPGRQVELKIAPDVRALCDPDMMHIVLQNLLENAWKYSGKIEHAVIEFGAERQDGYEVYFVKDNGAGFDPQFADKLFGVFQRLHKPEDFEGTGVGLATVQRIVHRHGGRIWAEGKPGEGACFRFTLQPVTRLMETSL